jgi:EAL domain-containing protein (putative c-di-GMP-specific phosphodiesterase class I)
VRLAIDDFGTGYSCLSYLRQFPVDVLKIDRSFVSDLETNEDDRAICGVILSIAQKLSLDSVAEGVRSEQQVAILVKHGCRLGQGHYFSVPVRADEITRLLSEGTSRASGRDRPEGESTTMAAR